MKGGQVAVPSELAAAQDGTPPGRSHLPILHTLVNQALHHIARMHVHCAQCDEPLAIVLAQWAVDQANEITVWEPSRWRRRLARVQGFRRCAVALVHTLKPLTPAASSGAPAPF